MSMFIYMSCHMISCNVISCIRSSHVTRGRPAGPAGPAGLRPNTPGFHNKIPALKIFARGWVTQEPICS